MSTASSDEYLVGDAAISASLDEKPPRLQWPFLIVAVLAMGGLALFALGSLNRGIAALVLSMGLAAALRLVLPSATAGWLASRSRSVDVLCFAGLAAGLAGTLMLLK